MHQDLSIPVRARIDHESLSGWSDKDGMLFVQPPDEVLDQLVAVRLHIDACGLEDGPLRVVPGSHVSGRLSVAEAQQTRERSGETPCEVSQGGALVIKPLLLHASSKASGQSRRRVLHFVFGPRRLPCGLSWRTAVE
jgi:ectoine hydroxylase-related dioxygenase (phytanoyl-CoA dioxygenase family)